ncbi:MAG: hypothetical protein R2851_03860 [Caldilineaceae bacterium]
MASRAELNYVPSRTAPRSSPGAVARLIVSDITNPYFAELTRTVAAAAATAGYDLVTLDTNYDPAMLAVHLDHLHTHRIDGLFMFYHRT